MTHVSSLLWASCLLLLFSAATATPGTTVTPDAPAGDEILSLPGLKKQPSFKQYSGYLPASGSKKLHYWFVESQNNPATDPVVLWLNGGPGCSSDLGFLTEHGPFRVQDDGVTLLDNPFSWNLVANMLYLEAPAGVGYSYSDDGNYTTNDDLVAHDNYLALKHFFQAFPSFTGNEFFITGESYGGVYVPSLSALVVDDSSINFKGFAVGNGLSSYDLNDDSLIYFVYYHGLIGEDLWFKMVKSCCHGDANNCSFSQAARLSTECMSYVNTVSNLVYAGGLNIYNLYGPCVKNSGRLGYGFGGQSLVTANFGWGFAHSPYIKAERKFIENLRGGRSNARLSLTPPCINAKGAIAYMNSKDVRKALHIPSNLPEWQPCSDLDYHRTYKEMSAQYKKVLNRGKRVLVYNGDVDMACNFLGDEWFTDSLGQQVVKTRSEWTYTDEVGSTQVAGFVKAFDKLTFVTVRGAGHMVPTDRPRPALKMFINFITNKPFN
ncbi:lysosomal protective protein-like [Babylonia areolata]|uniref:lysosomal protective protein-like n=1 Tax=Babylonia areolata TaxID=304850 RepID=UPI003FD40640